MARPPGTALALFVTLAAAACVGSVPERSLDELVVRDSTYFVPETMQPYSGRVYRAFEDDPSSMEIEGSLVDGTWHGEMVVYHPSGRVRYMGGFANGDRCGPWTENADDTEPESLYQELRREIATLGMYPPCPPDLDE